MLFYLSSWLEGLWGPLRLFSSHLFLMGATAAVAGALTFFFLPRLWHVLPKDRGRINTPDPTKAKGRPTGAGFLLYGFLVLTSFLLQPPDPGILWVHVCLFFVMLTGYLDDRSVTPWGRAIKGTLDLALGILTSLALCQGRPVEMWIPLTLHSFTVPAWAFVTIGTAVLWFSINVTNCTDGIDSLAGSLTLLSLFSLGVLLYTVIGHREFARHLVVPHDPRGAAWAIFCMSTCGVLGGYLWHNAPPSRVLMGDAGSRFLGLVLGVAVLMSGNPFLIVVIAPVALVNGGGGLVKLAILKFFIALGFDVSPESIAKASKHERETNGRRQIVRPALREGRYALLSFLHRYRFPLHDHCLKNLKWSDSQVLVRFMLLQAFLTPLLLLLVVKVR